ncbi:phenylacetate-CoA oxygenase subunit PaaJ [Marinobacterium sp. D7]|uniref:1,2-phenylacetyl-CoA epoxidase subunit PaaD n=1 Tax=Marinobacterium ramblicola TaxID=2849041 RepID=UPI001C2D491E|nr:1,2-phenylacetyl-CoA epoxidase subunit PaaD [Marinobacterium ramblicola]MBV1787346.1 phenylacetate-CoA oxygenase subunit PaaJ [Marinobacterium ramblicola]
MIREFDNTQADHRNQPLIATDRAGQQLEQPSIEAIWTLLDAVPDPEVPVVSVVDLGIVRDLQWDLQSGMRQLVVTLTPTYSGCPATEFIEEAIAEALHAAGIANVRLHQQLAPAWTTDWITESGREKLRQYGIAPPVGSASKRTLLGEEPEVACPQCGSHDTVQVSEFGSTACKALYRCNSCLEPFDYFKCI